MRPEARRGWVEPSMRLWSSPSWASSRSTTCSPKRCWRRTQKSQSSNEELRFETSMYGRRRRPQGVRVMPGWLAVPRDWLASLGDIARFSGRVMGIVYSGRVMRFFGEALRQAGILILGSTIVIWGLVFILGLQCGIEGAYFNR